MHFLLLPPGGRIPAKIKQNLADFQRFLKFLKYKYKEEKYPQEKYTIKEVKIAKLMVFLSNGNSEHVALM